MAAANDGCRFTRSRKTTTPDDLTEKQAYAPKPRSLRLSKTASTAIALKDNCAVVIPKLLSQNTKNIEKPERQSPARKRTRVDNGNVGRNENDSKNKVFIVVLLIYISSLSTCRRVATICQSGFDNLLF